MFVLESLPRRWIIIMSKRVAFSFHIKICIRLDIKCSPICENCVNHSIPFLPEPILETYIASFYISSMRFCGMNILPSFHGQIWTFSPGVLNTFPSSGYCRKLRRDRMKINWKWSRVYLAFSFLPPFDNVPVTWNPQYRPWGFSSSLEAPTAF